MHPMFQPWTSRNRLRNQRLTNRRLRSYGDNLSRASEGRWFSKRKPFSDERLRDTWTRGPICPQTNLNSVARGKGCSSPRFCCRRSSDSRGGHGMIGAIAPASRHVAQALLPVPLRFESNIPAQPRVAVLLTRPRRGLVFSNFLQQHILQRCATTSQPRGIDQ